jgi:hypothetical protein
MSERERLARYVIPAERLRLEVEEPAQPRLETLQKTLDNLLLGMSSTTSVVRSHEAQHKVKIAYGRSWKKAWRPG